MMTTGYEKMKELEELYHSSNFPKTKTMYLNEAMMGTLMNACHIDEFVGTKKEIEIETDKRKSIATDLYKYDREEYNRTVIDPIAEAMYNHTIENTPDNLKKAIPKIYSMAYEDGHSAGYSEVYSYYQSLIADLEEVLRLLNK